MATPIEQALALANAGQPVPEALQIQVFQFAGANNIGAADLERIFNVPAGSAAATTQALGIAAQVPMSLGGNLAPSGIGQMGLPPTTAGGVQYDPSLTVPNTSTQRLSNPMQ